jgi:hypothetical protein
VISPTASCACCRGSRTQPRMSSAATTAVGNEVLRLADIGAAGVAGLLGRFGLELVPLPAQASIPGSYWGESEAGLEGARLYVRPDTPVHSVLHEGSHFICMSPQRRARLNRDAGGDDLEEAAVCYLQILLADELPAVGCARLIRDMDAWGYSFRLGKTHAWFCSDAEHERAWLLRHGVIDASGHPTGALRL